MEYRHTEDMGEISGFGGGYEKCCQDMLDAGARFLLETKPSADPQFRGFKDVYGIIMEDNDDAKALTKAVIDAAKGEATGAMHQAVISRCLYIKKNGWAKYCEEVKKRAREDTAAD